MMADDFSDRCPQSTKVDNLIPWPTFISLATEGQHCAPQEKKVKAIAIVVTISAIFSTSLAAQSPYVADKSREIKALSQHEIEGYLNGRGMGSARAAELNGYPGPRHVLDMAEKLELAEEQKDRTQAIYETMNAQAAALGKQLVENERELDNRFSDGSIDEKSLDSLVSAIGVLRTKLRHVHLAAHLEQKRLLSEHQVQLYTTLRGYNAEHGDEHNHLR